MNTLADTLQEAGDEDTATEDTVRDVQKSPPWRLAVNQDQILRHPELAVHFKSPYITRTGLIMPNRVVVEFDHGLKNEAVALYYDIRARGLVVFRNWLD